VRRRRLLEAALACSLALHAVLLLVPIYWDRTPAPPQQVLNARLAPKPVPPAPKPEAPAPKPEPAAKPAPPAAPKTPPRAAPPPKPAAQPTPAPAPQPAPVIQATPQTPAAPEAPRMAPAPATPAPPAAAPAAAPRPDAAAAAAAVQEADLIAQYRVEVIEVAIRLRRYPLIARDNNWQGQSDVRLALSADGGIAALAVRKGSGFKVLDEEALAMIRGAHGKVPVPAALRGKPFAIDVPVIFELKN
jgi:protein TonB